LVKSTRSCCCTANTLLSTNSLSNLLSSSPSFSASASSSSPLSAVGFDDSGIWKSNSESRGRGK
jgi:hypothetical protein